MFISLLVFGLEKLKHLFRYLYGGSKFQEILLKKNKQVADVFLPDFRPYLKATVVKII
jgi:hypothetical protein